MSYLTKNTFSLSIRSLLIKNMDLYVTTFFTDKYQHDISHKNMAIWSFIFSYFVLFDNIDGVDF